MLPASELKVGLKISPDRHHLTPHHIQSTQLRFSSRAAAQREESNYCADSSGSWKESSCEIDSSNNSNRVSNN